jgi:D-alanyl-lipoteichoic acid acyltransferase DltB (MBOAT superfamily)
MLFTSLQYCLFFAGVTGLYYGLPHWFRRWLLLLASYVFYATWQPAYVLLLFLSTCVTYVTALRRWTAVGITMNLTTLFVFKYFNFFQESITAAANWLRIEYAPFEHAWLLPVGISFYTFQALSYIIDVQRGRQEAERDFGYVALYLAFFPTLLAGPIERASHLLPQLRKHVSFNPTTVSMGLRWILWGFFMKVVIADNAARYVNEIYGNVHAYVGWPLLLATYFFAIQIFCDFAGYSLIAIGSARVLGIDLIQNFRRPYLAASFGDFWRRWHISLSSWFRDYVYIPLGGSRNGRIRTLLNVFITFFLSGLWHGASWTFVLWGLLHGLYLIVESLLTFVIPEQWRKRWLRWSWLRILLVFHLTCLAWIFFRADSIVDAFYVLTHLWPFGSAPSVWQEIHTTIPTIILVLLLGATLVLVTVAQEWWKHRLSFHRWPVWIRWGFDYAVLFGILFLQSNMSPDFIYFQF